MGQVPVPLGQKTHDSKGSAIASRSLVKGSSWKDVWSLTQERLVMWLTSAKRVEADSLGAEVRFATDQTVGPEGIRLEGTTEQAHGAGLRGATDEDHHPFGPSLQVRLPPDRERAPLGSSLDAGGGALAVSADIAPGALLEVRERIVVEARPDLGLPSAVEVFDGGLESAFLRRHKDRDDIEAQAGPHNATDRVSMLMRALEDGVVVELCVGRPPALSPVLHERLHRGLRGHQRLGPGAGQPAMQGNDVEDLEADATFERQALDRVEAVEFGSTRRHLGEVPTLRRRRAADPAPGVKSSSSLEDAADRPHRRHQDVASSHELVVDGPGPVLTQIARLLQLAPQAEHEVLDRRFGPMDPSRDRRTITPIDAVQGEIPGTSAPPLNGE